MSSSNREQGPLPELAIEELVGNVEDGKEAHDSLTEANLRLVVSVAKKIHG